MKFFHNFVLPLAVLSSSANKVSALKCGIKGVTKPCVGDTDPRYDDSVGHNFVEQNDFWRKYDGLYIVDHTQYDNNGTIVVSQPFDFAPQLGDYNFLPTRQYVNNTIVGSRIYANSHILYGNVDSNKPGIVSLLGTLQQKRLHGGLLLGSCKIRHTVLLLFLDTMQQYVYFLFLQLTLLWFIGTR